MNVIKHKFILIIIIVQLIAFCLYYPGLLGGYLFDDSINLENLNVYSIFDGFEAIIRYILSYEAGPLKRPVSTLSFLLNADSWPTQPYYFKLTNVFIHLFNGLLLYLVIKKLLKTIYPNSQHIKIIAIISMAIWLLHPYFVSTTLYVIQRMAMLPVTFVLLGFIFYLNGREIIVKNKFKGRLYLFFSVYICTTLAVLSKENGIILPILLLLLEYIISGRENETKLLKIEKWFFLLIPTIFITVAFIYKIPSFIEGYDIREFTFIERLLTQPRVLITYLYHLFIPEYFTEGVYTDGFSLSKSLINPITTLYSIILILVLIVVAIVFRRKFPVFSFAVLFYFIAHVIESSIIPLEIYFEHRSYLPSLFLFIPLAVGLVNLTRISKIYYLVILALIGLLAFTTFLRVNLWSNNTRIFMQTADKFPQSMRAIDRKVATLYTSGFTNQAIQLMQNNLQLHDDISLRANIVNLNCSLDKTTKKDFILLTDYIKLNKITKEDRNALIAILKLLANGQCTDNSILVGLDLLDTIKNNLGYSNKKIGNLVGYFEGILNLRLGEIDKSSQIFHDYINNFDAFDDIIIAINQYIEIKEYEIAIDLLDHMENILQQKQYRYTKRDYNQSIKELRLKIKKLNE